MILRAILGKYSENLKEMHSYQKQLFAQIKPLTSAYKNSCQFIVVVNVTNISSRRTLKIRLITFRNATNSYTISAKQFNKVAISKEDFVRQFRYCGCHVMSFLCNICTCIALHVILSVFIS